ncbi:MAG TPA: M56 family metallopeptidase [Terracidiphilus sp.]|nr:M56 family metallopeptidase [Terracidiphilus sp.]
MDLISIFEAFRAASQVAAPVVVTALWQGAVVAAGLAVCLRIAPRMSATHRFTLWSSGFITLVCLPVLPLLSRFVSAPTVASSSSLGAALPSPWFQLDIRWAIAITALWAAGTILRAADLFVHSIRLFGLWKSATPIDWSACSIPAPASLSRIGGRRPVEICTTAHLDRPSVIGFFAPRILIPAWLLDRLTPSELQQIVLHEAEHLHRRDDWTNLVQKFGLILFPLNPALLWIEHRLCREREMACDEAVIRATRAPRAYAACLTSLAERGLRRRAEALSLGAWQRRAELVSRVHSILSHPRALSPLATRALLGTLGCGLIAGSIELARCPQFIAFIPRHTQSAQTIARENAQTNSPHALNALYEETHTAASSHRAPRLHARNAIPHLPATPREDSAPLQASIPNSGLHALPVVAEMKEPSSGRSSQSPRQVNLQAAMPASKKPAQPRNQPQEWIVLTTWEQVQTSAPASQADSGDTATSTAAKEAGDQKDPSGNKASRQITVTRLIFRVIPIRSMSDQPDAPQIRGGWLVLQL